MLRCASQQVGGAQIRVGSCVRSGGEAVGDAMVGGAEHTVWRYCAADGRAPPTLIHKEGRKRLYLGSVDAALCPEWLAQQEASMLTRGGGESMFVSRIGKHRVASCPATCPDCAPCRRHSHPFYARCREAIVWQGFDPVAVGKYAGRGYAGSWQALNNSAC